MKFRLDQGAPNAVTLAVCECGWRGLAMGPEAAMVRLRSHEKAQHPGDDNVLKAIQARRRRAKTAKRR